VLTHGSIAHRLRDIQTLPYVVVANPHLAHVYELYLTAFERFRRVPEIRTLDDNERYCKILQETLTEHATVIPRLALGVLEVRGLMRPEATDKFMNTMLRSVRHFSWCHGCCASADPGSASPAVSLRSSTWP
jgi:pyruvate dehydrogenase kinase 2/3/4